MNIGRSGSTGAPAQAPPVARFAYGQKGERGRFKCPCGSRRRYHSCCGKPRKGAANGS